MFFLWRLHQENEPCQILTGLLWWHPEPVAISLTWTFFVEIYVRIYSCLSVLYYPTNDTLISRHVRISNLKMLGYSLIGLTGSYIYSMCWVNGNTAPYTATELIFVLISIGSQSLDVLQMLTYTYYKLVLSQKLSIDGIINSSFTCLTNNMLTFECK